MSTPNKQAQHWHKVKTATSKQLKSIHTGKASKKNVKNKSNLKNLLKQAKSALNKSFK